LRSVLIDIPVSLVGAFLIMYILGFSSTSSHFLAIVLATGLVVDDIVVTENIFKKVEGTDSHGGGICRFIEIFAVIST
jgi:multidrug efflux pump subunit AcrB